MKCPFCEKGSIRSTKYPEEISYQEDTLRVDDLEASECDSCGQEFILPNQARRNHARIVDAKRKSIGLLTGEEIRGLRTNWKITQKQASKYFGGGVNSFSKYERGDVVQSEPMDKLIRLTDAFPFALGFLRMLSGEGIPSDYSGKQSEKLVSMNDENYRSRSVSGEKVTLVESDYESSKDCA